MSLTILCVSSREEYADPFVMEMIALSARLGAWFVEYNGEGAGCIERVLDAAVNECNDGYILRLDDDERVTPEMEEWLATESYWEADHWCFPRLHLYPDEQHFIASDPLWPDMQTRLSRKHMSGGRTIIHQGSPHGPGRSAPVAIEHHKFLCRSFEERVALVERYEEMQQGAGYAFSVFSVPENFHDLKVLPR